MSEMQQYHNYSGNLQSAIENIRESDEINEGNREIASGMIEWYKLDKKSDGRVFKYATCLKKTFENIEMALTGLEDTEEWKKKYLNMK